MPKKQVTYECPDLPNVPCCFAMCSSRATLRIRTKTGWANVCERHDIEIQDRETKEWLVDNGLKRDAQEASREWISRMLEHARATKLGRVGGPGRAVPIADLLMVPDGPPAPPAPPTASPGPSSTPYPDLLQAFADWSEAPASEDELEAV